MSAVSLQRTATLSFLIHISLFGITLLTMRQSNHFVMPSPYVVNLVSPEAVSGSQNTAPKILENKTAEKSRSDSKDSLAAEKNRPERNASMSAPKTLHRSGEKLIDERIKELKQTEKNERMVEERISKLSEIENIKRNLKIGEIISVKRENHETKMSLATGAAGQERGSLTDDYGRLVSEEIRRQWQFPTDLLKDKNIQAIVSIRVQKNGSVQILGLEKSSGNPLFDRSVLRAITKASPVPSPPYEMEIGVRFYP